MRRAADLSFVELAPFDQSALQLEWNFTDRADRLYRTGHRLLARGFIAEAAEAFGRAAAYDRSHYDAYVAQSEALVMMGQVYGAVRTIEAAMERYGRNVALGAARAHVFLHEGDRDHALECVDIAIRSDPESAYSWLIAGEIRLSLHDAYPFAMDCFARSRAAACPWPNLELRIATALCEWGQPDHAARSLKAILQSDPELPLAWILLGDMQRLLGNRAESRACYRRAVELSPELASRVAGLRLGSRLAALVRSLKGLFGRRPETARTRHSAS